MGEAVITTAGNLPAKYVIHTVGPRWNDGSHKEVELLINCYINCFKLAYENGVTTISFPNISTGIYKFPKDKAAEIALQTIKNNLSNYPCIEKVNIVCYEVENYDIYRFILMD